MKGPPSKKPKGVWIFEVAGPVLRAALCVREAKQVRVSELIVEKLEEPSREAIRGILAGIAAGPEGKCPAWVLVSRSTTMLRTLEIPSTETQELAAMVDLQVGKLSPYSREEITTDWHSLPSQKEGFSFVVLAIAPRYLLPDLLESLNEFQFPVARVGLVSSALPCFTPESPSAHLVVEVGFDYTEIQVVSNRQILFSRAVPMGESHLSGDEAEDTEKLFLEVKRSLEILQNEQVVTLLPEQVMLLGASRHLERLQARIGGELKMPCRIAPPLEKLFVFSEQAKQALQSSRQTESFYGILGVFGMPGVRHFDLMPTELKLRKAMEVFTKQVVRTGVLAVVLVMALSFLFGERIQKRRWVLEKLEQRYQETAPQAQGAEKMRHLIDFAQRQMEPEASALRFLEIIYSAIPTDAYCVNLSFEKDKKLSVRGYATGMPVVFNFVTELNKPGRLKGAETKYATKRKIQEKELVEFEIVGQFGS